MKKIVVLLMVVGLSLSAVAVEEKEKPTLKGWGDLLFKALDGQAQSTKEYQKEQWKEGKEKVKDLGKSISNFFGGLWNSKEKDEEDWNGVDDEIKENKGGILGVRN